MDRSIRASLRALICLVACVGALTLLLAAPRPAAALTVPSIEPSGETGFTIGAWSLDAALGHCEIYCTPGEPSASQVATSAAGRLVWSWTPNWKWTTTSDVGLAEHTVYTYWMYDFGLDGTQLSCTPYVVRTGSQVWGHVLDTDSTPLVGAPVRLYAPTTYTAEDYAVIETTTTGEGGVYGFDTDVQSIDRPQVGASDPTSATPETFFGGGFYPQDVPLRAPSRYGLPRRADIQLDPAYGTLIGTIVSARDGAPVASATVTLLRNTPTYDSEGAIVSWRYVIAGKLMTKPDGTFSARVRPGDYEIEAVEYAFLEKATQTPVRVSVGATASAGTVALTPAWDFPPVFTDPWELNDTTTTANPIQTDGTEFVGYCDQSGSDYMSFPAKRGKMYGVTVTTKGYGCWGRIGLYDGAGARVAPLPAAGQGYTFLGSVPGTQTTTLWAVSDGDKPLYVGWDLMGATESYTSLNYPPGALVRYTVTVNEYDPPLITGRVTDPKTGMPLEGARVRVWCNPQRWINETLPRSSDSYETTLTAADGTYRLETPFPCVAWVGFEDPAGRLVGELYPHSATAQPVGMNPGVTPLSCSADGVNSGIDGYLRQPGVLLVQAKRVDTGEPVKDARFNVGSPVTDAAWPGYWDLPSTDASGTSAIALDPRKSYQLHVSELQWNWSPAWYAGYRFVAFDQPIDFTPSDGETYTVNAVYALAASDVSITVPSQAVLPSSRFVLTGSVTWLGSAVSSQTVHIEASADGSVWRTISETSTLADGSFSIETIESGTPFYRARFAGFHDAGAGDSAVVVLAVAAAPPVPAAPPVATSLSAPSVSPSRLKRNATATFRATLTPAPAALAGTSTLRLYRYETKTVRKKVRGRWKKVKVNYWRLRATKVMGAGVDGSLATSYKLRYSGKWKATVNYEGPPAWIASGPGSKSFTVK